MPESRTLIAMPPSGTGDAAMRHRSAGGGELHGVGKQVQHDLAQPSFIAAQQRQVFRRDTLQRHPRGPRGGVHHAPAGRQQVGRHQLGFDQLNTAGFDACHIEDVIDQGQQVAAASLTALAYSPIRWPRASASATIAASWPIASENPITAF
ncbi:MAG: hypothetical protein HC804_11255, partial [Anaerolineae bacterium]|nr:hypothetical protein [Anaerolineae bacterium]